MQFTFLRDVVPFRIVGRYQYFEGIYFLHLQGRQNTGTPHMPVWRLNPAAYLWIQLTLNILYWQLAVLNKMYCRYEQRQVLELLCTNYSVHIEHIS